ncbi:MAG: hypothetical protein ABIJ91_02090 [Candidatus Kuenenbacteria bacterium]
MGNANFSKKECIRALLKIGFIKEPHQARRSPHDKYLVPMTYKQEMRRLFIMIPHGRKLKCQGAILKELKKNWW